jgi:hypothetical protein
LEPDHLSVHSLHEDFFRPLHWPSACARNGPKQNRRNSKAKAANPTWVPVNSPERRCKGCI